MQGGKFKSRWMVTSPCDFYQPRQQRRKARSGKPAILIHISANACADACGCPCGCGRTLAKDHCGCQKPPKNGRGCISGVWEIQSNRKQPALRMPNGVCGTLYGGEGVFCRFLPFPRWRLRVAEFSSSQLRLPCLFPNLALPRVDSPSGLASQTWPCHILGSHRGWFLRNRCHMLTSSKAVSSTVAPAMRASGRPPRMPTNLLHHGSQNRIQKTSRNMAARKGPRLYKKQSGTQREKKHVLTLTLMLVRRKSACKTLCGQQQNSPMADPTFGSKSKSQNGAQAKT